MADKEAEQIKYETELLKLMALFILAVGGSAIGLLLGERTTFRLVLAFLGVVLNAILVFGIWRQHGTIRKLISQIKEKETPP